MRGQTTLDFAIGISIFLSVMLFVFAFAPGILQPFTVSGQSDTVTVDKVADRLVQDALGSPREPFVLDRHCTVAFFDRSDPDADLTAPSRCRYDDGTLAEQAGVLERQNVNVSVSGNVSSGTDGSNRLFWDDSERELVEVPAGTVDGGDVVLAAGDDVPTRNAATVTATRVVELHGHDVTVTVVMW